MDHAALTRDLFPSGKDVHARPTKSAPREAGAARELLHQMQESPRKSGQGALHPRIGRRCVREVLTAANLLEVRVKRAPQAELLAIEVTHPSAARTVHRSEVLRAFLRGKHVAHGQAKAALEVGERCTGS